LWFENARQFMSLSPMELALSVMMRSGRVSYGDLKQRDPDFINAYEGATTLLPPGRRL